MLWCLGRQYLEKAIPKFITLALLGRPIPIHGDGSARRSFLFCKDAVEAFDVVFHRGQRHHVYNIGTEDEISVLELANMILEMVNTDKPEAERTSTIEFVRDRNFNDRRYYVCNAKMSQLGWKPSTSFQQGLYETYQWYKENAAAVFGDLAKHPALQAHPPSTYGQT